MESEKKVYYKHFFYAFLFSNILIFFIVLFITGGESSKALLFADEGEMFMDFFNSMLQNAEDPYACGVLYPPLSNCMYKFLLSFVPQRYINRFLEDEPTAYFDNDVLKMQQYMIPYIIYVIITSILLFFVLVYYKKGSKAERILFTVGAVFSGPMIFQFERANSILVAFILSLVFFLTYDSKNKVLREIGLISLAIASAIKIYPIVFAVFLLKDKRYKDLIRALVYCTVLFVVPMFRYYGGFEGIKALLANLTAYGVNDNRQLSTGVQLNFAKMLVLPLSLTNMSNETIISVGEMFRFVMAFSCCASALFSKSRWKTAALCAAVIYGFQETCATYLLILFLIPVIMFLDSERVHSKMNYVYLFLLTVIVSGPACVNPVTGQWTRFVGTKISSYCILILSIMLIVSAIKDMAAFFYGLFNIKKEVTVAFFAVSLAIIVFGSLFVLPGGIPKNNLKIFGLIDISFIIQRGTLKNTIFAVLAVAVFAGLMFLCYWLPKDDKYNGFRQFVKFGIVGVSNTLVSLIVYYIFYFINSDLYIVGNAAGFIISVLHAYFLNSTFVFKADDDKKRSKGKILIRSYIAYGSTFLLSELLLVVQVEWISVSGMIAPIINLLITVPLNFILNKFWTYNEKGKKKNNALPQSGSKEE